MALRLVLFDLDGTLIDTAQDFYAVVNQLLKENNKAELAFDPIRNTVSKGARALIELAFNLKEGDDGFSTLHQRLLSLYSEQICNNSKLFEGMTETLQQIEQQGLLWGVVTNKPREYTEPLLEALNLYNRTATVVCPNEVVNKKPHPEPLLLACKQANCSPAESIYVGDDLRDIQSARNASMVSIAALYGYIGINENPLHWQADFNINTPNELINVISDLNNST